jgi:protein-tyrosine phosphatase
MDCNRILERLIVGEYPALPEDAEWLARHLGVSAVLNLQTDQDLRVLGIDWEKLERAYDRLGIEVRRVAIRDFDRDDLALHLPRAVRELRELLDAGHTVYLHCSAGAGRSPSVATAYLYWVEGLGLVDAERRVLARRPCSPDLDAIESAER